MVNKNLNEFAVNLPLEVGGASSYNIIQPKLEPNATIFKINDCNLTPILEVRKNGDILVRGVLSTSDKEIVEALREFAQKI